MDTLRISNKEKVDSIDWKYYWVDEQEEVNNETSSPNKMNEYKTDKDDSIKDKKYLI